MSIGIKLRQARETQAISLDQAAQATHIRLHYLEALEADRFELLPSAAQVRGFLRVYGEYLKLNPAELLHTLDGNLPLLTTERLPAQIYEDEVLPLTSSDAIFKELGKKLSSQRELMGLSLGDVERHTHIRMHYVRALEEGDLSHLPSPVQGRGMLSNYATFLGLNTESVLLRFADGLQASLYSRQAARDTGLEKPPREDTGRLPARPSQLRRLFSMDLFVSGFLILFLLGFAIWGGLRVSSLSSSQEVSPTTPPVSEVLLSTQTQVISATLPVFPGATLSLTSTVTIDAALIEDPAQAFFTETPAVIESTPIDSNAPIQVVVVARQRAWVRITVDDEVAFQGRVVPGSAYSYAANQRIDLLTGDGGSLQVYYNEQDLGVLGAYGEVVSRVFSIEGVQTATPAVPPPPPPPPPRTHRYGHPHTYSHAHGYPSHTFSNPQTLIYRYTGLLL
jgi:cytoskeletal protein RodZ